MSFDPRHVTWLLQSENVFHWGRGYNEDIKLLVQVVLAHRVRIEMLILLAR